MSMVKQVRQSGAQVSGAHTIAQERVRHLFPLSPERRRRRLVASAVFIMESKSRTIRHRGARETAESDFVSFCVVRWQIALVKIILPPARRNRVIILFGMLVGSHARREENTSCKR